MDCVKEIQEENQWIVNPDILFRDLLNKMHNDREDMGKEYTISEITNKLDRINKQKKIIENESSYDTAKKVMFSERNGRDYFLFNNREKQDKLTKIVRKKEKGFRWELYKDEKVSINPKYRMRIIAGNNEKRFYDMCKDNLLSELLRGKKSFYSDGIDDNKVSISVDNSIEIGDKKILIEIDSGNMAKLIVGQYTLLNILCNSIEKSNIVFIVIHYYKDYNTKRTEKNLKLVSKAVFNDNGIRFKVFNIKEFEKICKNNKGNKDSFIKQLLS